MITRRKLMLAGAGVAAAGAQLFGKGRAAQAAAPAKSGGSGGYLPVTTPNGVTLPFKWDNGVKVFHLVAELVKREFAPGFVVECWGYNGQSPGPTIECVEGDRVRIHVTNKLPEATAVHWHGLLLPHPMDGVGGLSQPRIKPGETFTYEFPIRQHGTQMYHSHVDDMTQFPLGMHGFFVIHPKEPHDPPVDRDFCLFLNEWKIEPGTSRPNPLEMLDMNYFTFNGRVFPGTDPLVIRAGQRVRLRYANLSMPAHAIHLHGFRGWVTGTDGGRIPKSAWWPETTVAVPAGSTRDFEFIADEPGDWPLHCHMPHHVMNGMVHGMPHVLGAKMGPNEEKIKKLLPAYMAMGETGNLMDHDMGRMKNTLFMGGSPGPYGDLIDMGGLFTLVKVRKGIKSYEDPGWYTDKIDPTWGRYSEKDIPG